MSSLSVPLNNKFSTRSSANMNANMNTNMNSQMMLDNFKSMMITMAMVKGSSQSDSQSSFTNTIIIMLIVSFIDTIVLQIKNLFSIVGVKINNYISNKTKDISLINNLSLTTTKLKKTSIIVKVEIA